MVNEQTLPRLYPDQALMPKVFDASNVDRATCDHFQRGRKKERGPRVRPGLLTGRWRVPQIATIMIQDLFSSFS